MKPPWLTDDEWCRYLSEFDISRPLPAQMADAHQRAIEINLMLDVNQFEIVSLEDANTLRRMVNS